MWEREYSIETNTSPERVWAIFRDVPNWTKWIAGLDRIELKGPFQAGSSYVMTPSGQGPLVTNIVEMEENKHFLDETRLGDITVQVDHRIENIAPNRTRIVYCARVTGPSAEEIGQAISADFPNVLKSLAALAESKGA